MKGEVAITRALAEAGFTPTFIQRPIHPPVPFVDSGWYLEAKSADDEIILTAPTVAGIKALIRQYKEFA